MGAGPAMEHAAQEGPLDEARAWAVLSALAARSSAGRPLDRAAGVFLDAAGEIEVTASGRGIVDIDPLREGGFSPDPRATGQVAQLLALYLPLCVGAHAGTIVYAHLGQSLDGQVATASGASRFLSGGENLRHMHRLRALCDAVIVGAATVEHDDPQLTTRLVPGRSPVRVVIDPQLRLPAHRRLFQDEVAQTLVLCAAGRKNGRELGHAEIVEVACEDGMLPPRSILGALRQRGLGRIFVEGGGVTVSRFMEAGALDRLHVTICPLFIGKGRPGILLPGIDRLDRAWRPRTRRFSQDEDVLFDCELDRRSPGRSPLSRLR